MSDKLLKYMKLTKVDPVKNLLYGVFTAEVLDKSNEIADYETTKAAFKAFSDDFVKVSGGKSLGNVRKMHTAEIAGGIKSIDYDDAQKMISGCVEVTPEIAAQAQKGWLNGFSIGGGYAKRWPDTVHKNAKRFTPIIAELSVVDNPCVPDATFDAIKDASFAIINADGTEVMHKYALKPQGEVTVKYQAKDGSLHDTEDLAKAKNTEIAKAADPVEDALKKLEKAADPEEKKDDDKGDDKDTLSCEQVEKALTGDLTEDQVTGLRKLFKNDEMFKGWKAPAAKPDLSADLTKMTAERDALQKKLDDVPARIEAALEKVNKRLKGIEEQPAAGGGALFAVEKEKGIGDVTPIGRSVSPGDMTKRL